MSDPQTLPTDRPPPGDTPGTKELDVEIQEYIAGLVVAVEARLEEKIAGVALNLTKEVHNMCIHLGTISDNTKILVNASAALEKMGDILLKAHEENLSLARELGIIWSDKERARLERERG